VITEIVSFWHRDCFKRPQSGTKVRSQINGGVEMKKLGAVVIGSLLVLGVFALAHSNFLGSGPAFACGGMGGMGSWGAAGGGDYVPQRRGLSNSFANRAPALSEGQAHDVVANHLKRLNPDLTIGQMKDAGSYYEAEVLGANGDVVQRLGVDKESGRMILIN
jgi:hypothetical protein